MRSCRVCQIEKPLDAFYEVKHRNGNRYRKNTCKSCVCENLRQTDHERRSAYQKAWIKTNHDQWLILKRATRLKAAAKNGRLVRNIIEVREGASRRRERNALLIVLKKRLRGLVPPLSSRAKWIKLYSSNGEYRRAQIEKAVRRKQRQREQSDGTLTGKECYRLLVEYNDCLYCGSILSKQNRTLDHIVPIANGGIHGVSNVIVCCKSCNCRRGAKLIDRWISNEGVTTPEIARLRLKSRGIDPPIKTIF